MKASLARTNAVQKLLVPVLSTGEDSSFLNFLAPSRAEFRALPVALRTEGRLQDTLKICKKRLLKANMPASATKFLPVIESRTPGREVLAAAMTHDDHDLLVLHKDIHCSALGIQPVDVLTAPQCSVALLSGTLQKPPSRILVPLREGPHGELAIRLARLLAPCGAAVLPLTASKSRKRRGNALSALRRVWWRLRGVQILDEVDNHVECILEHAKDFDLIVMGSASNPFGPPMSLCEVGGGVIDCSPVPVAVVKSKELRAVPAEEAPPGAHPISVVVDRWFEERTFQADEFDDVQKLLALKKKQGLTISVALPARNEEATIGDIITKIKRNLMRKVPLVDELILVDSSSTDRTRDIAASLGIPVHVHPEVLAGEGAFEGKGEALWKSLHATKGDIIVWVDTDIADFTPQFISALVGPLLTLKDVDLVKGFFRRPLRLKDNLTSGEGGGRVTELCARPLINLFYPELSGFLQPLSGQYAGRREALESVPFFTGYGVEIGLLIDLFETRGLWSLAQVDLIRLTHNNQPLQSLGKMSFEIMQAFLKKLERRFGYHLVEELNTSMKLIRHDSSAYSLDVVELVEEERPPIVSVAEYRTAHGGGR